MELQWSHANSGKHGAAGEGFSARDSRTITQILERNPEDDFECTYFRQPTTRNPIKVKKGGGLFPMTLSYTMPSELSDGYTDSDSESDNTSNVERWLESLPANDAWSSAPNYSALDGSEGLEGNDEIQEDSKKSPENDLRTCLNSINDLQKNFAPKPGDSKVQVTEDDLTKRMCNRADEMSVMEEWLDRKMPRKKIKRTLKTRQKIPMWTKEEQKGRTDLEKEEFSEGKTNGKNDPWSSISKSYGSPERNSPIDEKAAWSQSNTLETTESKTAIKKSSVEEDGYDEMMQEMVNRLLTVSRCRGVKSTSKQILLKPKTESFSSIDSVKDFKILCDSKKSEETVDSSLSRFRMKRARYSATLKKTSSKLAKTKVDGNKLSKCIKNALKTKTKTQNQKRMEKIRQRRKPSVTKHQLKPVEKTQCVDISQTFIKNIDPIKKKPHFRTVRFQDEVIPRNLSETWRQAAMIKAARNKQILQTVEQIVEDIQSQGLQYGKKYICAEPGEIQKMSKNFISEPAPGDTIELKKSGSWRSNRKRPMHSIENKTIGCRKPMFSNPFVENCLDKAMDLALSKYKRPQNTWANFNKEKLRENMSSAAYEPPAKKRKPKSVISKLENTTRQDFSLFNSWQSIHNYFLSYSPCK